MVADVVSLIDGTCARAQLPLDIRGTSFQERVWRALLATSAGQTLSYAELAARIGQPRAARAAAGACASNSLAVVVPCHRAVRGSGELSGYKWGVQRKQVLLEMERAVAGAGPPDPPIGRPAEG